MEILKFGRWTVLGPGTRTQDRACRCECGTEKDVRWQYLRDGRSQSCGCKQREEVAARMRLHRFKHGHSPSGQPYSPTYLSWMHIKQRCLYKGSQNYPMYGGRGISVCARWMDFQNFLADMGERPAGMSIERIDVDGDYEPGNCRWATRLEQERNKRTSLKYLYQGRERCLSEIAELSGMKYGLLHDRLKRHNWTLEKALSTPSRQFKK